jgi:hypothetical protein
MIAPCNSLIVSMNLCKHKKSEIMLKTKLDPRLFNTVQTRILSATANASAREVQHAGCFTFYPRRKLLDEEVGLFPLN